jgi:putative oxidoreductase
MLKRALAPNADRIYAVLRVVSGLLFAFHGLQKIFGVMAPGAMHFPSQAWFGGVIELVGGVFVALGLFTRCAAFICSGEMAVAYFQFHWRLQGGAKFFPTQQGGNGGELAVLYCFLFLYVAAKGVGTWGADARRGA